MTFANTESSFGVELNVYMGSTLNDKGLFILQQDTSLLITSVARCILPESHRLG